MNTNENQLKINEYYWESHKHKWKSMIIKSHIQGNQWESNAKQSKTMEPKENQGESYKMQIKINENWKVYENHIRTNENKWKQIRHHEM